jgi:uncharacterized protein
MEVFRGGQLSEVLTLRLDRGEDVLESITSTARAAGFREAVVLSGIGTLDHARLHFITHTDYPPKDQFVEYDGPIELVSIQGLIADFVPHLHTCLSIGETSYMGHLEPGCRVLYLAEIVIGHLRYVAFHRLLDKATNVRLLRAREES